MTLQPHPLNARSASLIMFAALAGIGLWLFVPWGSARLSSGGGGSDHASVPATLKLDGAVQSETQDNVITRLVVPLSVDGNEGSLQVSDTGDLRAETFLSESAAAAVPGTYKLERLDGNGDGSLDPGEHAQLVVDLPTRSSVHPGNPLNIVLKTADGSPLTLENVLQ